MSSAQKVNVYGLGYVGTVTALGLAKRGYSVVGVDRDVSKVSSFRAGRVPFEEPSLQGLLRETGRHFRAVSADDEIPSAKFWIICVGTPLGPDGRLDLSQVDSALRDMAPRLRASQKPLLLLRSTVLPGTLRAHLIPVLEKSGLRHGTDFEAFSVPEFMREGSAVEDFENPPLSVIGAMSGATETEQVASLFGGGGASRKIEVTGPETAEIVKCASNAFHAMKIGFANEIGSLCRSIGIDGAEAMKIFASDRKLNVSEAYLRPGFAFGGPCLGKDLDGLGAMMREKGIRAPLLESVHPSNRSHLERCRKILLEFPRGGRLGVLGIGFKPATGDQRNSRILELVSDPEVRSHFSEIAILDGAKLESELPGCDALVLGSEKPSAAALNGVLSFSGPILDLMYFAGVTKQLSKKPDVRSVC